MRAADGTPLAELAKRAARDPAVRRFPPAARPRVPRRRGSPLLRAPAASTTAASGARWAPTCAPARSRRAARRSRSRSRSRSCRRSGRCSGRSARRSWRGAWRRHFTQARHPDALPEPDLPRPRRRTASRRRRAATSTRRSAISTSARWRCSPAWRARRRGSRRSRAWRRARARRDQVLGDDGRRRLPDRRRGEPLARAPGRRAPAPRLLPHHVALLRRARAPRHRAPLRREEAARGRPRHRDDGGAVDRRLGAGERRLLAAQAGQAAGLARPGRAPGRRGGATSSARRIAARYGAEPPAEGRLYLGIVEADGGGRRVPRARRQGDLHAAAARG